MSTVVVGTGRLAVALTTAWVRGARPGHLVVAGRRAEAAASVAVTARLHARLANSPATVEPVANRLACVADVVGLLDDHAAEVVVCCASRQSPWEGESSPSAWTSLLAATGLAGALPLHADLALTITRAAAEARRPVLTVNAAYPDAVNPLLAAVGAPALTGVGNAQVTHLALAEALGVADDRVAVIAHHRHLFGGGDDDALAWFDGTPVRDVTQRLVAQRTASRTQVNAVTGAAAARAVQALTTGPPLSTSLPGVDGRPGGYPVDVQPGGITWRLPPGVDRDTAVAANTRWGRAEGVSTSQGSVRFGPAVTAALAPHVGDELAHGFPVADLPTAVAAFAALRDRLRRRPPTRGLR